MGFQFTQCLMKAFSGQLFCTVALYVELKPKLFQLENAMFTGSGLAPLFTVKTPGPYTRMKQSE